MSIFSNGELKAENKDLKAKNAELEEKANTLEAANAELTEKVAAFETEKAELSQKLEAAEAAKLEAEKRATEAEEASKKVIEEQPKKVSEEAARQVAALGHEPVEQTEEDKTAAEGSLTLVAEYQQMKAGPDRDKFFRENKKELFKALNK